MDSSSDTERAAIAAAYLQRLLDDRANEAERPLAEYQAEFPGYEDVIAAEFAVVCGETVPVVAGDSVFSRMRERFGENPNPEVSLHGTRIDHADESSSSRYESVGELARGGMGIVFRVWDRDLRRSLAMKVLGGASTRDAVADSQRLTRFLEEAQVTAQLAHPGIVPVHELGLDAEGRVYFSMSLVRGFTFDRVIANVHDRDEDWSLARAIGVLQRVCETVAFAHERGVLHRDIKPANVMVGSFGETYVMDWGLAAVEERVDAGDIAIQSTRRELAAMRDDDALVTRVGDILGTPAYMAPEQARGETDTIGVRTDVYAVGAMLYHLLTARPPYSSHGKQILEAVRAAPPEPLHECCPDAPGELVAICTRAMARAPADRYASIVELGDDIAAHLEQRVVRAYETGAVAELRKWVRRNRAPALASGFAVLALVAGITASLILKGREARATESANKTSELAFAAVDKMLLRVGARRLRNVPQIDAVRRELLADAQAMLEVLDARRGRAGPGIELTRTLNQVGRLQRALGDYDDAIESQRRRIDLLEENALSAEDALPVRWSIVNARHELGTALVASGKREEGLREMQAGVDAADALLSREDAREDRLAQRLRIMRSIASAMEQLARRDEAIALFRDTADGWRALVERAPDPKGEYRFASADTLASLGRSLARHGVHDDAEAAYSEAAAGFDALTDEFPREAEYREFALHHGVAYSGVILISRGRYAEAVDYLGPLVDRLRAAVAEFPMRTPIRVTLGGALCNLGSALTAVRQYDDAAEVLGESIEAVRVALSTAPADATGQSFLISALTQSCRVQIRLQRVEQVMDSAEDLLALPFGGARPRCNAAMFLAACVQPALSSGHRDRSVRCAERAVFALQAAVDAGFKDAAFLDRAEFESLRENPEFVRLRAAVAVRR